MLRVEDPQLKIRGARCIFIARHLVEQVLLALEDLKVHVGVQVILKSPFERMLTKVGADEVTDVPFLEAIRVIQMIELILSAPVETQRLLVELDERSYLHIDCAHVWRRDARAVLNRMPGYNVEPGEAELEAILLGGQDQVLRHVRQDRVSHEIDVLVIQPAIEHNASVRRHQDDRDKRHNCSDSRPIDFLASEV